MEKKLPGLKLTKETLQHLGDESLTDVNGGASCFILSCHHNSGGPSVCVNC